MEQKLINSASPEQNGRHLVDNIFQMHFREWKILNFNQNFTEVCS